MTQKHAGNNITISLSPTHSQIAKGYHPTATPPPLMGTTAATQPTENTQQPVIQLTRQQPV